MFRPDGTITAGNAPGVNAGAAAMIVCEQATAETLGPVLRSWSPAVYDPATLSAARVESLGGAARTAAVTDVLATALVDQVVEADLAVDPTSSVARRAVIAHEIEPSGLSVEQLDDYYRPENYSRGLYG